jgi:hypothetical protein
VAKSRIESSVDNGKLTVVVLQVEGGNETLRQGIRSLEAAIEKLGPTQPTMVIAKKTVGQLLSKSGPLTDAGPDAEKFEQLELEGTLSDEDDTVLQEVETPKRRLKRYRTPKIVDVDFSKSPPLKLMFEEHGSPQESMSPWLIFSAWFKKVEGTAEISADHVYTALKHLDLEVPKDLLKPFSNLKGVGCVTSSKPGYFGINHIGEERLRKLKNSDLQP